MIRPRNARDTGLGVTSILIGVALLIGSRGLGAIPGQDYGADTLPFVIAMMALGVGIAMLVQTFRTHPVTEPASLADDTQKAPRNRAAWLRLAGGLALMLGYALFSEMTGFIISGFVVVTGLALLMGVRVHFALILGIIAAVSLRYVFADMLLVPLPRMSLPGIGG